METFYLLDIELSTAFHNWSQDIGSFPSHASDGKYEGHASPMSPLPPLLPFCSNNGYRTAGTDHRPAVLLQLLQKLQTKLKQ